MDPIQTPVLLVSMPNLNDPFFGKTLILLCDYTQESAYGMVINRPSNLTLRDILVEPGHFKGDLDHPILVGGPVQPELLWAIHSRDYQGDSTTVLQGDLAMSSVQDVLQSISEGNGPKHFHLGSGYAGWGAGQLDQEITEGSWWVADVDDALVLTMDYEARWNTVLQNIGIDPNTTSFFAPGEA